MNAIYHINRLKKKKHMATLTDREKTFDKIQHPQQDNKLGKSIYRKPTANVILNGERMNGSPLAWINNPNVYQLINE